MSWVMFDYGGVISHPQPDQDVAALAAVAGCSRTAFEAAYWAHRLGYDRGDLDGAAYWQQVGAALGTRFCDAQVADLIVRDTQSWLHLRADMVALVERLAQAGHRLALLSNAPRVLADAVAALPVARCFRHLAFSCFLRSAKPDPACYRAVLASMDAAPGDVVFIDDREENVASAAALGIAGVHFAGPAPSRAALTQHGITLEAPGAAGAQAGPAATPGYGE